LEEIKCIWNANLDLPWTEHKHHKTMSGGGIFVPPVVARQFSSFAERAGVKSENKNS
jgi:hypothetical protein